MTNKFDVLIIGGGPAGLSAAIYCARANLTCCIIEEKLAGGRPLGYLEIENYLGLGRTSTFEMVEKFRDHVESFNVPFFECEEILRVDLDNKIVETKSTTYEGKAIIIATGSKPRLLGVPGEQEFTGRGVHYCAICDGHFYKNKVVAVVGGGNSACEEALGLAEICKQIYLIECTDSLKADAVTVDLINKKDNIKVICGAEVQNIRGKDKVEYITIGYGFEAEEIPVDGVFPFIGFSPNSELFDVEKDAHGFICSDACMQTSK